MAWPTCQGYARKGWPVSVAQVILSVALPLAFGLAPWVLAWVSTRAAAGVLLAGLAFGAVGSITGGVPRVVSDLVLTAVALGGGLALGRVLSLRSWVMPVFLGLASAGDIAQNALLGGTGPGSTGGPGAAEPAWQAYAVLRVPLPGGHYDIGPLDLLLFTVIGEHWRRRRGSPAQSAGPGVLGMALVDVAPFQGSLPLIPFVFAGWLLTEGATRLIQRHGRKPQRPRRRAPPAS